MNFGHEISIISQGTTRPIIHGDVKTLNILLDKKYSVKVSDFRASVLISPRQTHIVEIVQGTIGYLDPEYLTTGELTMKGDVYSSGVILMELLTGETPIRQTKFGETINIVRSFISSMENQTLLHIIDIEASNEGEMREIKVVRLLARRCLNYSGVNRPTMREVAKKLARINKNLRLNQCNDEETHSLFNETRFDSLWTSISEINKLGSTYQSTLDIEVATAISSV
ncbi:hypothetical protein NL676_025421 [Syzygium grande]|nr:hypothetical protein NL676_025421 [Syzygium grande]